MLIDKRKPTRDRAWIQSAKDRPCDACGVQDGTVVFAHLRFEHSGGMGLKPPDWCGGFLCGNCHAFEGSNPASRPAFWMRVLRTLMIERYRAWKGER